MTAYAAADMDSPWQHFTRLAESALACVGRVHGPVQWFLAERHETGGRCTFSAGAGPLAPDTVLRWPLPLAPVTHERGYLVGSPLSETGPQPEGYLGLWIPEDQGPPCDTDLAMLQSKAILLGALMEQMRHGERLVHELESARHDAETDVLTGLLNRRGWLAQLEREQARCARYGSDCSMVAVDLDRLKQINDGQGHCAGDALLRNTARAIDETIRKPDICARVGGDEFVIMLAESDECAAHSFCLRLQERFGRDDIAASIGSATRLPGEHLKNTLCRADTNMYTHKHAGRPS